MQLMGVLEARIGKDGFKHVVELLTTDACSFLLGTCSAFPASWQAERLHL